jgi:hypothetical protein
VAVPNRTLEIQIELAWLADRLTFPGHLAAQVTTAGMEVRGYVGSVAAHDQALKIARQLTPLPVVDLLKVHTSLAEHAVPCKAAYLQLAVINHLKAACAGQAAAVEVACNDQGQVTLTGIVGSRDDKLAIAQQLRRVAGCSCVVNKIHIHGVPDEPEIAVPQSGAFAPKVNPPGSAASAQPKSDAGARTADVRPPEFSKPNPTAVVPPVPGPETWAKAPAAPKPGNGGMGAVAGAPAAPPVPVIDPWAMGKAPPAVSSTTSPYNAAPAPPAPTRPDSTIQHAVQLAPNPAPASAPSASPSSSAMPSPPPPVHAVAAVAPETWKPPSPTASTTKPANPEFKGGSGPAPQALGDPYVTTGVVLISEPEPVGGSAPAGAPGTNVTNSGMPAKAAAVPVPSAAPKAPPVPAPAAMMPKPAPVPPPAVTPAKAIPAPSSLAMGLKAAIERVCGPRIHDVRVEPQSGQAIVIHYSAQNAIEATQCWDKIQTLSELQPYDVHVEVHLPQ